MLFFIYLSPLTEKSSRISKKSGFGGKPQRGQAIQSDDQLIVICYNCYLLHKMAHDSTWKHQQMGYILPLTALGRSIIYLLP